MTIIPRCIYCDTTDDLSKSDVIPDALTNSKIYNRNVCRITHNNKFSDLFESAVISNLAFITNELDIKSSKSKSYPNYNAVYNIDGVDYDVKKISSDNHLLKNNSVLQSVDKKHKLGPLGIINQIARNESEVTEIDINSKEIQKTVKIAPEIFFSNEMSRLVSKIAYEWYCAKNKIIGVYSNFENIITHITTGEGHNPVSLLTSIPLNDSFKELCSHGSHSLIAYEENGTINVVVNLFGIAIYNVELTNRLLDKNVKNFIYQELCTDGSKEEIVYESLNDLFSDIFKILVDCTTTPHEGLTIFVAPPETKDSKLDIKIKLSTVIQFVLQGEHEVIQKPSAQTVNLIIKNIESLLQAALVHKNTLKRFIKENLKDKDTTFNLNPNSTSKKNSILFYIVYSIGKSLYDHLNLEIVNSIIRSSIGPTFNNEYVVTEAESEKFRSILLDDENYQEILLRGAKLIEAWE